MFAGGIFRYWELLQSSVLLSTRVCQSDHILHICRSKTEGKQSVKTTGQEWQTLFQITHPLDTSRFVTETLTKGVIFLWVIQLICLDKARVLPSTSLLCEKKKYHWVGNPFTGFIPHTDFDVVLSVTTISLFSALTLPSLWAIMASRLHKLNRFLSPSPLCSPGWLQHSFCKAGPEGAQHLLENTKCHERRSAIYELKQNKRRYSSDGAVNSTNTTWQILTLMAFAEPQGSGQLIPEDRLELSAAIRAVS